MGGVLNVLRYLEMIDGDIKEPNFRVLVRKSRWIRAPSGGLLHCLIGIGELVEEGQLEKHSIQKEDDDLYKDLDDLFV